MIRNKLLTKITLQSIYIIFHVRISLRNKYIIPSSNGVILDLHFANKYNTVVQRFHVNTKLTVKNNIGVG